MNRKQKELVVKTLQEDLQNSKASFLVGYRGLSVSQMQELRGKLRETGGQLKVVKARLIKRAVDGNEDIDHLDPYCKDQIGIVFAKEEASSVAKVLNKFSKSNDALRLVVGTMDAQVLSAEDIKVIASLPSREVLLAQLLGTMNAPLSALARDLNMLIVRFLVVLNKLAEKKQ